MRTIDQVRLAVAAAIVMSTAPPLAGQGPQAPATEAAIVTILEVLTSPRCLNCHPTDDRPRQGDEGRIHGFNVVRGAADRGWEAQRCATCHRDENNAYAGVPGAPHWALAPSSMGWLGLSGTEILRRLVDRELNGNRSREELVEHMSHDALVLWAWEPGNGRQPPPVPLDKFRDALAVWLTAEAGGESGGGQ